MADILSKDVMDKHPRAGGERGDSDTLEQGRFYPEKRGEEGETTVALPREEITRQVARIESGQPVPREMLAKAVAEAERTNRLPPAEVLEAALRYLQGNERRGEAKLKVDNPAAVSEFVERLRAATGESAEDNQS